MTIELPEKVFENNCYDFLCRLGEANQDDEIIIDFHKVSYYIPAAIVALITAIHKWNSETKTVKVVNYDACDAFRYLQRIDFFKYCNLQLPESFTRHAADGRFVPIKKNNLRHRGSLN